MNLRTDQIARRLAILTLLGMALQTGALADEPTLLLQLDRPPRGGVHFPSYDSDFGRVPEFTLYENGDVYWVVAMRTRAVLRHATLSETARDSIHALALQQYRVDPGRLTDSNSVIRPPDGYTEMLRVRDEAGILRERELQPRMRAPTSLAALVQSLRDFDDEQGRELAPERATLVVRSHDFTGGDPWPLATEHLEPNAPASEESIVVLSGETLSLLLASMPGNMTTLETSRYFNHAGQGHAVQLAPWLPGEDFTEAIAEYLKWSTEANHLRGSSSGTR